MEVVAMHMTRALAERADNGTGSVGVVPPPPGVTPDFQNPRDAGYSANIYGVSVCLSVATILFFVRTYVKIRIVRKFFFEDVTCTIAWATVVIYLVTVYMMTSYGVGRHVWEQTEETFTNSLKWLWGGSVAYGPAAFFTKATLLLLTARIFAVEQRVARAIYGFIIFILLLYIPIQVVKMVICLPIQSYWDKDVEGHCLDQKKAFVVDLSIAILADFVILILPIILTWNLRMHWKNKVKIWALLGAGGAAVASSLYRMFKAIQFLHTNDVTADIVALDLSAIVELTVGFICACLPAVNMLFQKKPNQRSDGNSPRTIKNTRLWRSWNPGFLSSIGKTSYHATSQHSAPSRMMSVAETKPRPVTVDIELGMTPNPEDGDFIAQHIRGHDKNRRKSHWFVHERVSSLGGMSQGPEEH